MFTIRLCPYTADHASDWDEFVKNAPMGTFLHTRRFLAYHRDRFQDESLLIYDAKDRLAAVFPAAREPGSPEIVCSHPGITYGGLLHRPNVRGEDVQAMFRDISIHYAGQGFRTLRYKAVPWIYHTIPLADDLYALNSLGASRTRCDLTCTVDLSRPRISSKRRQRSLANAKNQNLSLSEEMRHLPEYWDLLGSTLSKRHQAIPTHTCEEMAHLIQRFPEEIRLVTALDKAQVIAGAVLFLMKTAVHAQYIAASPKGFSTNALDLVFEHCFEFSRQLGVRYFDFGISTEQEGRRLNEGLYRFKHEFGGGSALHEFYELPLSPCAAST